MKIINTDILVLGSGIAGLSFAIKASSLGKVSIITKAASAESNTRLAQGGIACVWDKEDDFKKHINDTLVAGAGHCNVEAVEMMVNKAPEMIRELINAGVHFDLQKNKSIELGKEGGHSQNRILHISDRSGMAIENVLVEKAKSLSNIQFYEYHIAVDLIKQDNRCTGAVIWDKLNNEVVYFNSKVTVLATGGAGQVYAHTTNPSIATGDGYAMAYLTGAKLSDMEFVQFHPTALFHPGANGFLISEALRGFGAELVLPDRTRFMSRYHHMGSLAPRDIVSRAIVAEMKKNHIQCVYLDATFLNKEELTGKFPSIYETCLSLNIDITRQFIPVIPATHYMCGGVVTDRNGATNIDGLYAIGEVACTGVHGANRLASNSLLEGLVFAHAAYENITKNISQISTEQTDELSYGFNNSGKSVDAFTVSYLKNKVQNLMSENAGIIRNPKSLKSTGELLENILESVTKLIGKYRISQELIELRNITVTAKLIVSAALSRRKSIGTHYIEETSTINRKDQALV